MLVLKCRPDDDVSHFPSFYLSHSMPWPHLSVLPSLVTIRGDLWKEGPPFVCLVLTTFLPEIAPLLSSYGSPDLNFTPTPILSLVPPPRFPSSTESRSLITTGPLATLPKERSGDQELFAGSGGCLSFIRWGDWDMSNNQWLHGFVLVCFCPLRETFCQVVEGQGELGVLVKKNSEIYGNDYKLSWRLMITENKYV